jgi:hypothetical protein
MAEPVTITPKGFSRTYGDKPIILLPSVDAKKVGDKVAPIDDSSFKITLFTPIEKETYDNLESSGSTSIQKIKNEQGVEQYFGAVAEVKDNEIIFSDVVDELPTEVVDGLEKESNILTSEANSSLDSYLKETDTKVAATALPVIPNEAPSNTPNQSSIPLTTSLGSNVNYNKSKLNSEILVYPIDMSNEQDCIEFTVHQYENRDIANGFTELKAFDNVSEDKNFKQVPNSSTVYLPITKINDNNSVNWQEDTLNEIQRYLANTSLGLMQPGTNMGEIGEKISTAGNDLLSFGTGSAFGNYVRSYLAGQAVQAGNLLTRTTGTILNPNMELLFSGPLLRQFPFTFDLIAKNSEEATEVKKIIRFFKSNMAIRNRIVPTNEEGRTEGQTIGDGNNVFLSSPYLFKLRYLSGLGTGVDGKREVHKSIGQIKMCALQNCSVDYTPMGTYMTFSDRERTMFMYRITLSFKELTPIYNSDYNKEDSLIGF